MKLQRQPWTRSGANVSTARTVNQSALFASDMQEPAASFESTSSFAAIPLQPVPRGSGPLNSFMSGPLERGFASGPLQRGSGFMSGPIEKGVMSSPLNAADKSNFSAPLARDGLDANVFLASSDPIGLAC